MQQPDMVKMQTRLDFLGLGADEQSRLNRQKNAVDKAIEVALECLYAKLRTVPELQKMFSGEDAMTAARKRQHDHWLRILNATFDDDYCRSVLRIGEVHAEIGLDPCWYIGAYGIVLDSVLQNLISERKAWTGNSRLELGKDISVVIRAALLDIDVSTTAYLNRLASDRQKVEKQQKQDFAKIASALDQLAGGDLTVRLDARLNEQTRFNQTVEQLEKIITGVRRATEMIDNGSSEIAAAADDLARRTEQQAASLEETAASLDQLTSTVRESASRAKEAEAMANHAQEVAERSSGIADETRTAMAQVSDSAKEMGQIIGVINEIAFQTNLLALNAGVEAARAGESGRGFAVVAAEVRALAQRSSEAVSTIQQLIDKSAQQTQRGAELVGSTHEVLTEVVDLFRSISGLMIEMASTSRQQAGSISEINQAVRQLDSMTQQNAAMVEQTNATTANLKLEANTLSRVIGQFASERRLVRNYGT